MRKFLQGDIDFLGHSVDPNPAMHKKLYTEWQLLMGLGFVYIRVRTNFAGMLRLLFGAGCVTIVVVGTLKSAFSFLISAL